MHDRDEWRARKQAHRERWREERDRVRDEHRRRHEGRQDRHGRKGRVLHTRVSEQLSEDIRKLAEDLRVPASNLVRNVLEEVFDAVENVSEDMGGVFEEVLTEAEEARDRIHERLKRRRRAEHRRRGLDEDEIEDELRRDEASESRGSGPAPGRSRPASSASGPVGADEAERAEDVEPRPVPEFPDVIGWQMLVLNAAAECGVCRRALRRGDRAYIGLKESGFSPARLCRRCVPAG
jgi:hypothetical protein